MKQGHLPVVVIGAGPVGLAAASHLVERGLQPLVLEAGDDVAASVRDWGHVRLFSPWRFNVDRAAARLLEARGWTAPLGDALPTGHDFHEKYLRPLSEVPAIRSHLLLGRRVTDVGRVRIDKVRTKDRAETPFLVRTVGKDGSAEDLIARAVIDASGTWWTPNPLGATGLPATGESALRHRIHYGIPDVLGEHRQRYAGTTTLVAGAGHSAANSILALARLADESPATRILWATRGNNLARVFGGAEADALPARGKLGLELRKLVDDKRLIMLRDVQIQSVTEVGGRLRVAGTRVDEPFALDDIDGIIAATGQRPDLSITRELRLALDSALESAAELGPLIDPNQHSCGTVRPHGAKELAHPEPSFFTIGSKSYGRAPTFLLATGYEQARSVVALLAGDHQAAFRVELDLPETGVCSSKLAEEDASCCGPGAAACCGPTAREQRA